jgi:hypothetical protein
MAPPKKDNFAVTININPQSFIACSGGKTIRWRQWSKNDQNAFLQDTIQNSVNMNFVKELSFELTKQDNYHVHMLIEATPLNIEKFKRNICYFIDKRMPEAIKDRCCYITNVHDYDGWASYVNKQRLDNKEQLYDTLKDAIFNQ